MGRLAVGSSAELPHLPVTATTTPVSASTEQQHHHNDNQDQFHGSSPLMVVALVAANRTSNGVYKRWFPISVHVCPNRIRRA
jgi:hypothetical protein